MNNLYTRDRQWSHRERLVGKTPSGLYSFWGVFRWNATTEAVKNPRDLSRGLVALWHHWLFSVYDVCQTSLHMTDVKIIWTNLLTWIKFRVMVGYRLLRFVDCILCFEFVWRAWIFWIWNKQKSGELTNGWQSKTLRCDDVRKDLRKEGRARQSVTLFKGNVGTILAEFWNFGLRDTKIKNFK